MKKIILFIFFLASILPTYAEDTSHIQEKGYGFYVGIEEGGTTSISYMEVPFLCLNENKCEIEVGEIPLADEETFVHFTEDYYRNLFPTLPDDGNVHKYKKFEAREDLKMFSGFWFAAQRLKTNEHYAKDKDYVYYRGKIIEGAHPESFTFAGPLYPLSRHLYLSYPDIDYLEEYYKDKNHIYYEGKIVEGANSESFIPIVKTEDTSYVPYYKDKKNVYSNGKILKGLDPETFLSLEQYDDYKTYKDKDHVYCEGEIIEGADPATFNMYYSSTTSGYPLRMSPYSFYKDKNYAYLRNCERLQEYDVESFTVVAGHPIDKNSDLSVLDISSEDAIETLLNYNSIQSKKNMNEYRLNDFITRKEMIKILIKTTYGDPDGSCKFIFSDVIDDWACRYIEFADLLELGAISKNKYFHPDQNITKAEALKLVYNIYNIENTSFHPIENIDWKQNYINKARLDYFVYNDLDVDYNSYASRDWIFQLIAKVLNMVDAKVEY